MTRQRRTGVVKIAVSDAEKATLRRYAGPRAVATYMRHLALGSRPGAGASADDWWASLPAGRREQIHAFLAAPSQRGHAVTPGQTAMLFDDGETQA